MNHPNISTKWRNFQRIFSPFPAKMMTWCKIAHVSMKRYIPKNNRSFHKGYIWWQVLSTFLIFREVFLVKNPQETLNQLVFPAIFLGIFVGVKDPHAKIPDSYLWLSNWGSTMEGKRSRVVGLVVPWLLLHWSLCCMPCTSPGGVWFGLFTRKKNGCEDVKIACFFAILFNNIRTMIIN